MIRRTALEITIEIEADITLQKLQKQGVEIS